MDRGPKRIQSEGRGMAVQQHEAEELLCRRRWFHGAPNSGPAPEEFRRYLKEINRVSGTFPVRVKRRRPCAPSGLSA